MTKSYAIPFEELLPMSMEEFVEDYKGKKFFISRSEENRFANHFSWRELEIYLNGDGRNGHKRMPQLQIVNLEGKGGRYCHKKARRKVDIKAIHGAWWRGCSFILTLSEFLNETLWGQCEEFEHYYGIGQANLYCSSKKDAQCFPIHADSTDNFLFHVSGKVRWFIYNEFQHECKAQDATLNQVIDLDDGDFLYLPRKLYHKVQTLSPRISISFHFNESGQSWGSGRPQKRTAWLDYTSGIEEEVQRVLKNSS
jgi:hypothetical protein